MHKRTTLRVHLRFHAEAPQHIKHLLRDLWTTRRIVLQLLSFRRKPVVIVVQRMPLTIGDCLFALAPMSSYCYNNAWCIWSAEPEELRYFSP